MPKAVSPTVVPGASSTTSVTVRATGMASRMLSVRMVADSTEETSLGLMPAATTSTRSSVAAASLATKLTLAPVPVTTVMFSRTVAVPSTARRVTG